MAIANVNSPGNSNVGSTSQTVQSSLADKDTFLKLLAAQLKYQDPMNPVDNSEFLAQTAQFTAVEQMTALADATKANMFSNQMSQGVGMIGKTVTYQPPLDDAGNVPDQRTGSVSGVIVENGAVKLVVGADHVDVTQVIKIVENGDVTTDPGNPDPTDSDTGLSDPTDPTGTDDSVPDPEGSGS